MLQKCTCNQNADQQYQYQQNLGSQQQSGNSFGMYSLFAVPEDESSSMIRAAISSLNTSIQMTYNDQKARGVLNPMPGPAAPGLERNVETENYGDKLAKLYDKSGKPTKQLKSLQDLEKQIRAEKDESKQRELIEKYNKLEKDLFGYSAPSAKFGTDKGKKYDFYSNLSENELKNIKYNNDKIGSLKSEIKKIKEQLIETEQEIMKTAQRKGNTSDLVAKRTDLQKEYADACSKLKDDVSVNEKYITEAGKSSGSANLAEVERKEAQGKKTNEEKSAIEKAMFKDDKLAGKADDVKKKLKDSGIPEDVIDALGLKDGMTKSEIKDIIINNLANKMHGLSDIVKDDSKLSSLISIYVACGGTEKEVRDKLKA